MMDKSNRLLLVLAFFLIIIICIESYPLFFIRRKDYSYDLSFINVGKQKDSVVLEAGINRSVLEYLYSLPKGAMVSSVGQNVYKGILLDVRLESGRLGSFYYEKSLVLEGDNGKSYLLFLNNDLRALKIRDSFGNILSFEDLHPGDRVTIYEEIDFADKSNPIARKFNVIKE